jgi:hypothetical protein
VKKVGIIDNLGAAEINWNDFSAENVMSSTGGNTGNIAFVHGVNKIIKNEKIRIEWGTSIEDVKNNCSHIVICCANQLGAHVDLQEWADFLDKCNIPVTLIGLGAQSVSYDVLPKIQNGTLNFLNVVRKLRRDDNQNIAVRGDFTRNFLDSVGVESVALGCPSLFISDKKNLGNLVYQNSLRNQQRLSVAAGNPWDVKSASLERKLVDIVNDTGGEYVLQHPVEMFKLALGEKSTFDHRTMEAFVGFYGEAFNNDSIFDWFRRYSVFFDRADLWMNYMKKFDGVVGARYHGVALAVQAGIPGCVVAIDSRTRELCESTGIKYVTIMATDSMTESDIVELIPWSVHDAEIFDKNRFVKANGFVKFLENNMLTPSDSIINLSL